MSKYTTPEYSVQYGLENIPEDRTVEVSLRDLLYVYKTFEELNRFFHQPMHFETLEAVRRYLGNHRSGAYHLISECYYSKLRDVFPADIESAMVNDQLRPPDEKPEYFDPAFGTEDSTD